MPSFNQWKNSTKDLTNRKLLLLLCDIPYYLCSAKLSDNNVICSRFGQKQMPKTIYLFSLEWLYKDIQIGGEIRIFSDFVWSICNWIIYYLSLYFLFAKKMFEDFPSFINLFEAYHLSNHRDTVALCVQKRNKNHAKTKLNKSIQVLMDLIRINLPLNVVRWNSFVKLLHF